MFMAGERRVVILGGHGKIALLATGRLKDAGYAVDSVIRNPGQKNAVRAAGGNPLVLDLERATVYELAAVLAGAAASVFSAGAGGGNPERTRAVDYAAATRAMQAADRARVKRFVMISYVSAATDVERLDPDTAFYVYARAKHDADEALRRSALDYTILGPGRLIDKPATGKLQPTDTRGEVEGGWSADRKATSRANVAEAIACAIRANAAVRRTVNFYDGETPIADVLG